MAVLKKEIDMNMQEQKIYEYNRIYVYRVLKENIMKLILKPGEKISELNIKKTFNVSRSPIREAIVRLVDEELIDVFPQKGTYVSLLDPNLIEDS
ncbi:GntR family transcriptional regulator, partial [Brachyspira hampsonii]